MREAPQQPTRRFAAPLTVTPLPGLPLFQAGMSVAREIVEACAREGFDLAPGDAIVISQKIVSKAEGRAVRLRDVSPGPDALALAKASGRPAALAQLMIEESAEIVRATPSAIIARHRAGHVAANAGIDASNVEGGAEDTVLLWPRDPDASAAAIRTEIEALSGIAPAILIADSLGRAWRLGTLGQAIGAAGLVTVDDRRGESDLFGRTLQATIVGVADAIAAAAVLTMGEGNEGTPVALVRGAARFVREEAGGAAAIVRPLSEDLFR